MDNKKLIGQNEKRILDKLEQELSHKILRQHEIEGYFVDGFIPELNRVIEVDEKHHFDKKDQLKSKDIERQNKISEKLGCEFLRIKDEVSNDSKY